MLDYIGGNIKMGIEITITRGTAISRKEIQDLGKPLKQYKIT